MEDLEEISDSSFAQDDQNSFRTLQEGWQTEIEQIFDELREKEKVTSFFKKISALLLLTIMVKKFYYSSFLSVIILICKIVKAVTLALKYPNASMCTVVHKKTFSSGMQKSDFIPFVF